MALGLIPFAGIAFLWFMGVVRDRIGDYEDRFFSTVFFGSGLLFLAMVFVSAAAAGSLLVAYAEFPDQIFDTGIYTFGRDLTNRVSSIYSMRMAAVFMLSLATIGTRTRTMPLWLNIATYFLATRPSLRDQRQPLGVPRLPGVGSDDLRVLPHRRWARRCEWHVGLGRGMRVERLLTTVEWRSLFAKCVLDEDFPVAHGQEVTAVDL